MKGIWKLLLLTCSPHKCQENNLANVSQWFLLWSHTVSNPQIISSFITIMKLTGMEKKAFAVSIWKQKWREFRLHGKTCICREPVKIQRLNHVCIVYSLGYKAKKNQLQNSVIIIGSFYYFYNIGFFFLFYFWRSHCKAENFVSVMQNPCLFQWLKKNYVKIFRLKKITQMIARKKI